MIKAPCRARGKPIVQNMMTIQNNSTRPAESGDDALPIQGERLIRNVNWVGLKTLYLKEVRRFMKVQTQTVWAPAITTLLYLIIFTVALGGIKPSVLGVPFADFIAPGLIIMGMMQNSFANSSFSLLVGKIQGTIVDYLMPPLSNLELLVAMVGAAVTRAAMVGCTVWLAMALWPGVVRADGGDVAGADRRDDINLGGKIRSCGSDHQFRCRARRLAVGHLLLGR